MVRDYSKYLSHQNRKTSRKKKVFTSPCYNLQDVYIKFKEDNPKYKHLTFKTFVNICEEHNKLLAHAILEEGKEVLLPFRIGKFAVYNTKVFFSPKYVKKNYLKSVIFNKPIYNILTGETTNNDYKSRWWWSKKNCIIRNNQWYSFKPTRSYCVRLYQIITTDVEGYKRYLFRKT